jgi:hypothetical protein
MSKPPPAKFLQHIETKEVKPFGRVASAVIWCQSDIVPLALE